ncbi:MAG TPA: hypothetical protein VF251_10725 [Pyrinomonadaceae bacterium]
MNHSHSAFGLQISANLAIPTLPIVAPARATDVVVYLGDLPSWLQDAMPTAKIRIVGPSFDSSGTPTRILWELKDGSHFYYRYQDGTEFVLDNAGTKVWARWPNTLSLEDTATYLLGPIFGFLLRLRGYVCLHASAVSFRGRVAAFLGPAGEGKSTLAAAFAELGFAIVSDDVTVLVDRFDEFLVTPAYPCVRLWSDSVSGLYGKDAKLPLLTPNWDKLYLDLSKNGYRFQGQTLPLAAIYLLERRTGGPCVQQLSANEKIIALVGNSYGNFLLDREMRKSEFDVVTRLTTRVPVRRLSYPSNINSLTQTCDLVIRDLQSVVTELDAATRQVAAHAQ